MRLSIPLVGGLIVTIRRRLVLTTSLLTAALALPYALAASATSTMRYSITDLGTLGGFSSVALDINNNGQVVGSADVPGGRRHAYRWENGVMTDLGTMGIDTQFEAWGINNLGQVVGIATNTGDIAGAFFWEDGEMSIIGEAIMPKSAFAINDAGQIVGTAIFPPPDVGQRAFLFENDVLTDLGTLGGSVSIAWGINASGQIAGESFTDGTPGGAFLWDKGVMTNLGTLGGGGSEAWGLNDAAQVVGKARRADKVASAFLWESGVFTDLREATGLSISKAEDVNNQGQVIGSGWLYDPVEGGVVMADLLPPDTPWSSFLARAINDTGQIVGSATIDGFPRAFLMTPAAPIPATSTWGVLIAALALLVSGSLLLRRLGVRRQ